MVLLTKVGWVVSFRAAKAAGHFEEGDDLLTLALEGALALGHYVDVVYHVEETRARCVDDANDCSATCGQGLQQGQALRAGQIVQTPVTSRFKIIQTPH